MTNELDELAALGAVSADDSDEDSALAELGAVSSEEPAPQSNPISKLESFLAGGEQGASLSFSDEAASGIAAGLDKALGASKINQPAEGVIKNPKAKEIFEKEFGSDDSLKALYNEYLTANRNRLKDAEKANPKTYLGGGIAGGLAIPIGAGATALKGASMGQKMAMGAKAGMGLGALNAAGTSEAPVMSPEFAQEVVTGGAAGTLMGGAAPPVLAGMGKAALGTLSAARRLGEKVVGPVGDIFDLSREVGSITTPAGQKIVQKQVGDFASSAAPKMQGDIEKLAGLKYDIIDNAAKRGFKHNVDDIDAVLNKVKSHRLKTHIEEAPAELEKLQKLVKSFKEGSSIRDAEDLSSPKVIAQLQDDLKRVTQFGDKSIKEPEVSGLAGGATQGVRDLQRKLIPGLEKVDNDISAYKRAAEALGIKDTRDINEAQIRDKILGLLNSENSTGVAAIKSGERFDSVIGEIQKANPRFAQQLRDDVDKFSSRISTIKAVNQPIGWSPISWIRGGATQVANAAGSTVGSIEKTIQKNKNKGTAVVDLMKSETPEWMQQKATQVAAMGGKVGEELSRILIQGASKEERGRNALIFSLMQNPAYRQLLEDDKPVEQQK